ncbi:MAG: hypothetical protein NT007_04485 [Candidatus Kapabacteria bacterium]|nr:hypothetical protein [Candidatus Kapabacteria bacterium]
MKASKSSFELEGHNTKQIIIFIAIIVALIVCFIPLILPFFKNLLTDYLNAEVFNNGEWLPLIKDDKKGQLFLTNPYFFWAVDIYRKSASETRIWLNPGLSLLIPSLIIDFGCAILITTLLPQKIGVMRHKIEREIIKAIEMITYNKFGEYSDINRGQIYNEVMNLDLRYIREMAHDYSISAEDLRVLYKAIIWSHSSFFKKMINIGDGINIYMRYYFTSKYSNIVLGLVYVGAAVLIIIVGLRGLKFIPPTHPTAVLLALGLEFTLLIIYAVTLMFARSEDENDIGEQIHTSEATLLGSDFGSSKEIENLLRVFLKKKSS